MGRNTKADAQVQVSAFRVAAADATGLNVVARVSTGDDSDGVSAGGANAAPGADAAAPAVETGTGVAAQVPATGSVGLDPKPAATDMTVRAFLCSRTLT